MKVWIELPEGWAPQQVIITRMRKLGYVAEKVGAGDKWKLVLS